MNEKIVLSPEHGGTGYNNIEDFKESLNIPTASVSDGYFKDGALSIEHGGTGYNNIEDFKKSLNIKVPSVGPIATITTSVLPIENGGTGVSDKNDFISSLNFQNIYLQKQDFNNYFDNENDKQILKISNGGTGAATVDDACKNLGAFKNGVMEDSESQGWLDTSQYNTNNLIIRDNQVEKNPTSNNNIFNSGVYFADKNGKCTGYLRQYNNASNNVGIQLASERYVNGETKEINIVCYVKEDGNSYIESNYDYFNSNLYFTTNKNICFTNFLQSFRQGIAPGESIASGHIYFRDSNKDLVGWIENYVSAAGTTRQSIASRKHKDDGTYVTNALYLDIKSDGTPTVGFTQPQAWRDGLGLSNRPAACILRGLTTAQNLTTSYAKIKLNDYSHECDPDGIFSISDNGVKVSKSGTYLVSYQMRYSNATAGDSVWCKLYWKDVSNSNTISNAQVATLCCSGGTGGMVTGSSYLAQFGANDIIYLYGYNASAARGTVPTSIGTFLSVQYIGS